VYRQSLGMATQQGPYLVNASVSGAVSVSVAYRLWSDLSSTVAEDTWPASLVANLIQIDDDPPAM